jgi:hypothetical protein
MLSSVTQKPRGEHDGAEDTVKLVGLMPVRNEAWVLGLSLRAALLWVDEMLVLDHASTDGTHEVVARVAAEHPGRLRFLAETDPVWREASIRQRLLEAGREAGATHLCVIDADEVLTGNLLPSAREAFAALAPGEGLWLPWLPLWRGLDRYRQDQPSPWDVMILGFRDAPGLHYAPRLRDYDIHSRRVRGASGERHPVADQRAGGVFHLAHSNWRRLQTKTAWYKMIEITRFPWRRSPAELDDWYSWDLKETGLDLRAVDPSWWLPYATWLDEVELDGDCWYEAECRKLWADHGPDTFAGLELWGVPQGSAGAHVAGRGGAKGADVVVSSSPASRLLRGHGAHAAAAAAPIEE